MSNKIVPTIYRAVIDDVIASIRPEFDEYGVSEDVLAELQSKWENKVIASHVAEFEAPPPAPAPAHPQHPPYPPHSIHMQHPHHYPPPHNPYMSQQPPPGPQVKAEPVDNRYMLSSQPYALPPLPGPQIPGARPPASGQPNGMPYLHYPHGAAGRPPSTGPGTAPSPPTARYPPSGSAQNGQPQPPPQAQPPRIPQVDGPSSSSSDSPSPPPPNQGYAPRSSHPSLPQPAQGGSTAQAPDEEAINSDLDDSDSDNEAEGEEGGGADSDIVFCTYDKVGVDGEDRSRGS
ncbi:hypothetical protein AcV7_003799 [Taiwanofungus camphoratus]|nr:hypothetical protein AcV7_003799 [Antrodia cinnamomea]